MALLPVQTVVALVKGHGLKDLDWTFQEHFSLHKKQSTTALVTLNSVKHFSLSFVKTWPR